MTTANTIREERWERRLSQRTGRAGNLGCYQEKEEVPGEQFCLAGIQVPSSHGDRMDGRSQGPIREIVFEPTGV